MAGDEPAKGLFDFVMNMHGILRKIERGGHGPEENKGGKPIAAACPARRWASGWKSRWPATAASPPTPKAKIGLPEIMVGIFPGAGGTTRLARMLGAMAAAPVPAGGQDARPQKGQGGGLVDEVVAPDDLLDERQGLGARGRRGPRPS
jgi:3-hydroxyacyl-CoA dehydrogenase/enoyl-CoA hydratase/3-hydroxybutyryl-CoA epimerase